jgi:hypothetical protein
MTASSLTARNPHVKRSPKPRLLAVLAGTTRTILTIVKVEPLGAGLTPPDEEMGSEWTGIRTIPAGTDDTSVRNPTARKTAIRAARVERGSV